MSNHLESRYEPASASLSDDGVQEMLALAERLREANGGVLDDAAIMAVSEATGAPPEYVRLAVKLRPQKQGNLIDTTRDAFLAFEPDTRRYVVSGLLASALALTHSLAEWSRDPYQVGGIFIIIGITGALYNIAVSKDAKAAATAGAVLGSTYFILHAIFNAFFKVPGLEAFVLLPVTLGCMLGGLVVQKIVDQYRGKLGLSDPVQERQQLLRQLVDLQERLRSGEQAITFVSVDIVGSTRMKHMADPLSVEFTFTEYHKFVEMIVRRYGGRVHSTAGDGMTLAFDHPQQGYAASRTIQAGMIELNTFRNKIGVPLVLRCGIHTGKVVAPDAGDVTSINFASVIDIAAHLQKACPPGGVAISEEAARMLPGGPSAVGSEPIQLEHGLTGVVWLPRALASAPGMTPPPLPSEQPAQ